MRRAGAGSLALLVLLVAACTSDSSDGSDGAASGDQSRPVMLKVMEFNIEYGGEEVDFDSVVEAIEVSDADVVGVEEAWGNIPRLADELGWEHFDPRTQVISRHPLLAPPGGDALYTFVAVEPGRVAAIGNVHLPSSPYAPFRVRDGLGPKEVIALERRARLPALVPVRDALSALAEDKIPSFLLGDFNAPSRLDWTPEAVGIRKHVKYPLDWPMSKTMQEAGFLDSYREVHPDPVSKPGITWPAVRPFVEGYNPGMKNAPADRIDFIYAAGPATPIDSRLVGEKSSKLVDIPISPWPTDHRAVLSTFEIEPGIPPDMVAATPYLSEPGDELRVTFHSPGDEGERVTVVPEGGDPEAEAVADRSTGEGEPTDGTLTFSTEGWQPDAYEAVLLGGSGDEIARAAFWIQAPGAEPRIETAKRIHGLGEPIEVEWSDAPGNRWDWIGVYRRGADPNVASYLTWLYTEATVAGSEVLDEDASGAWPLEPGSYSAYLLEDDGYEMLARGDFKVHD